MDFGGLVQYGRSPTRTARLTNPVRRWAWWLVGPYFRGAGREIDANLVEIDRRLAAIDGKNAETNRKLAEIDNRLAHLVGTATHTPSPGVRDITDGAIVELVRSSVASHLAGLRKDASAVAHRLAGIEEELGGLETAAAQAAASRAAVEALQGALDTTRKELGAATQVLKERVDTLATQTGEASAWAIGFQQEIRAAIQVSKERIDTLASRAGEASTWIAGVQQESQSMIQAANLRIDSLARGTSLRAGDRISVGKGGLVMVASPSGMQILVRQDDLIGRIVADGQEWEPHVRSEIERSARPDGIAVDVGAYIGLHTLTMSRWFKTVHAFEPQRGIFQILCGNLALNNRLNVLPHNTGLYDRAGSMRLAPQERQEVDTPVVDGHPDYEHIKNAAALGFDFITEGEGDVPAIALDDMALENVALIKVDAQGADLRVLRGAEATIRRCRPTILFEWERDLSQQHGGVLEDYTAFFEELGYGLVVLQETSPGRQADYIARPR
jgi:FkbM family methyltransferase